MNYIIHHKNVVGMANEMKRAVDDYWGREITEIELKELLWKWAGTKKVFKANDYVVTVKRILGKSRLEVVDRLLEGYQIRR